jgi:hypothetical protein
MKRTSSTRITTSVLILLTVALASATAQTKAAQTVTVASVAGARPPAGAQTKPPDSLELAPCQEITQLMENGDPVNKKSFRFALGWWSRGFLEGALLSIDADAATKSDEFGLGVETAATRIVAYCNEHPTETPMEAVQYMLLDALK